MIKLNEQRKIFKIHSTFLKDNKWNLDIPPENARIEYPDMIVALGESQLLRWLDELTGKTDVNWKIAALKNNIKVEKKKNITSKTKYRIRDMYRDMFALQFQPNYIEVVMDKSNHYDLANQGFTVNGIRFKRLLGTNGGIKQSTIVYVNEELYPELKKRIDNGRNMNKELVPAKLEAYQALTASGSTPIESLMAMHKPSENIQKHLKWYHREMPVSINNCVVNRICRIFEQEFLNFAPSAVGEFDYTILKSNVGYTQPQYKAIKQIYEDYKIRVASFMNEANSTTMDKDTANERKQFFMSEFVEQCEKVCTNSKVLCDIVIDICYGANSSKTFAWAICGERIVANLLERNNYMINIPIRDDDGEIEYCGYHFRLDKVEYRKDEPNARIYFE